MNIYTRLTITVCKSKIYLAICKFLVHRLPLINIPELFINRINSKNSDFIAQEIYKKVGIGTWENPDISGETVAHRLLKDYYSRRNISPVIFDVGANSGEYTTKLSEIIPNANFYCFEPNPVAYVKLNSLSSDRIHAVDLGLGEKDADSIIFTYPDDESSQHASLFREVISDLHKSKNTKRFKVRITSLDSFCIRQKIDHVNVLKIDTEGNEYSVLRGAKDLIRLRAIDFVLFEFNEMNIISRVFLRDFYRVLPNYFFYRLSSVGLIPLGKYNSLNEHFIFQNILAVRQDINAMFSRLIKD